MNRNNPINEALKAEILENAPVLLSFHDAWHHIIWANLAYCQATGVSLEEMGHQKCYYAWGLKKPCRNCPVTLALKAGISSEAELSPETQEHWPASQGFWLIKAVPVKDARGEIIGAIEVALNITKRKKAEKQLQQTCEQLERLVHLRTKELKKSEARLNRSQQVAKVATWERDLSTDERFWSDELYRLFGYEPYELSIDKILEKHLPPQEKQRLEEHITNRIQEQQNINFQFHFDTKQGEQRIARIVGNVEENEGGAPYIYGIMQDITEQIKAEEALQQSREDYEKLLLSAKHLDSYRNIIGKSKPMRQIFTLIQQLAGVDTTVLITGESGTGKELVVDALHSSGSRAKGPLIKVNCSALSEHLLESELFGHVRGAFTGAISQKIGRIESAEGGTLFLDEIGEISQNTQLKLLRFLQEKQFERVGDNKTLYADVRIVAATNADLPEKVQEGHFRKDLYYRLKVMQIHMPPLRERAEDIPLLVSHFCRRFSKIFDKKITGVSDEVMKLFMEQQWPGNIRELEHALEHGAILCPSGKIRFKHLPKEIQFVNEYDFKQWPGERRIDRERLLEVLHESKGDKTAAARKLGISRRTLYRKLHAFGLMEKTE